MKYTLKLESILKENRRCELWIESLHGTWTMALDVLSGEEVRPKFSEVHGWGTGAALVQTTT